MRIIRKDGQKDYYDYLMGVLGQDDLVVYDRRDAFPIDPTKKWDDCYGSKHAYPCSCSDYQNTNIERWFSKNPIYSDKKRESIRRWSTKKVLEYDKQKQETELELEYIESLIYSINEATSISVLEEIKFEKTVVMGETRRG